MKNLLDQEVPESSSLYLKQDSNPQSIISEKFTNISDTNQALADTSKNQEQEGLIKFQPSSLDKPIPSVVSWNHNK